MIRRLPAINNLQTVLTQAISDTTDHVHILDATGWPNEGVFSICGEAMYYEGLIQESPAGWTFQNVQRGFDGTTAAPHSAGQRVQLRFIARHLDEIWEALDLRESTFQHAWNDSLTRTLMTFPMNYIVKEVEVAVLTAFDPLAGSPEPFLWLGTAGTPDLFMGSADLELDQQGVHYSRVHAVPGPFDLNLTMNPGLATQGEVLITVKGAELLP